MLEWKELMIQNADNVKFAILELYGSCIERTSLGSALGVETRKLGKFATSVSDFQSH